MGGMFVLATLLSVSTDVPSTPQHYANGLANAENDEELATSVKELLSNEGIVKAEGLKVLIAYDTRPTGPSLAEAAAAGARALGVEPELLGLLTTPQLHWGVMMRNKNQPSDEASYCSTLANAFKRLVGVNAKEENVTLYVDCANGVGAPKLARLAPLLEESGLKLVLRNRGGGALNGGCGSDFLQKDKKLPETFEDLPPGTRCAAIDGDADRLMYFTPVENPKGYAQLFDGDRIATLAAAYCHDLLDALPNGGINATIGIVQTAYANGASSHYMMSELGCAVELTPTGVKYLHEAAHHFDIGVYFEANGHGMVLLKPSFLDKVKAIAAAQGDSGAAADFLALADAINQSVGDAISGILLVEAALRRKGWSLEQWGSLYADLPSRQLKVKVADRTLITTKDAETKVAHPKMLQGLIDKEVGLVSKGRSFVRPSGTEDVVRVYAEAETQELADILAERVAALVHEHAGGID